jgi:hypothetical protein
MKNQSIANNIDWISIIIYAFILVGSHSSSLSEDTYEQLILLY